MPQCGFTVILKLLWPGLHVGDWKAVHHQVPQLMSRGIAKAVGGLLVFNDERWYARHGE